MIPKRIKRTLGSVLAGLIMLLAVTGTIPTTYAVNDTMDLKVLTYNTHMFINSAVGQWASSTNVYGDEQRGKEIINRLMTCDADIVALQEVWDSGSQNKFIENLRSKYPYAYVDNVKLDACPSGVADIFSRWILRQTDNPLIGSGLVLLSKYELSDYNFQIYNGAGCNPIDEIVATFGKTFSQDAVVDFIEANSDQYSSKGVLTAIVKTPLGKVKIGITHAFTNMGGADQPNMELLASQSYDPETPSIIMGDFNVHRDKRGKTNEIFANYDAMDVCAIISIKEEDSWTIDNYGNTCGNHFQPPSAPRPTDPVKNPTNDLDRIDYTFYRNSTLGTISLKPAATEVIRDWKTSIPECSNLDCSDHYPVMTTFKISKTTPTPAERHLDAAFTKQYELIWQDRGSGGEFDGAYFRPICAPGFLPVGYFGQSYYGTPIESVITIRPHNVNDVAYPVDYEHVWADWGSGADMDGSFWKPIPPTGYVAMGMVVTSGVKPALNAVYCVNRDLVVGARVGDFLWNDSRTGSEVNLGSWKIGKVANGISPNTFFGITSHTKPATHPTLYNFKSNVLHLDKMN